MARGANKHVVKKWIIENINILFWKERNKAKWKEYKVNLARLARTEPTKYAALLSHFEGQN